MACDPPAGMGQPTTWASWPSSMPKPAVMGESSESMECPARPANNAGASSPLNRARPRDDAERMPGRP